MKNMFILPALLLVIHTAFLMNSCTPAINPKLLPLAENLDLKTSTDKDDLALGRKYYIQQCAGCHNHIWPSKYTPRQWKLTLKNHRGRVHLSKQEYEKLKNYVLLVSELAQ